MVRGNCVEQRLVQGRIAKGRGRGYDGGMKVKKLLHTRYRVNDLGKTIQFYQVVLGLEVTRRSKSPRGSGPRRRREWVRRGNGVPRRQRIASGKLASPRPLCAAFCVL